MISYFLKFANVRIDLQIMSAIKKTVLIVDDEEMVRKSTSRTMRLLGFDIIEAASFSGAVEILNHCQPDLVFTDFRLGDGTGYDVIKAARQRFPSLPIILTSGDLAEAGVMQAIELGACAFVAKPFSIEYVGSALKLAFPVDVHA
jgi:DNA-binding NtrC family response regulator